jgi:hypothetical protein
MFEIDNISLQENTRTKHIQFKELLEVENGQVVRPILLFIFNCLKTGIRKQNFTA